MKRINSRRKGAQGERDASKFLQSLGFADARRGQQFKGTPDSPDVQCSALDWVRVEVKSYGTLPGPALLDQWWDQAETEARDAGRQPALLWRANRQPWRLVFVADRPGLRVQVDDPTRIKCALIFLNTLNEETTPEGSRP